MKKIFSLMLSFMLILSLAACGKEGAMPGKGEMNSGEQEWTVKEAIYTYPSGYASVCYTSELKDDSFIMSFLTEYRKDEVSRDSIIFEYDSNGITKMIEEEQDFGKDAERGDETTITYDEATSTLTRLAMEDGKESSKQVYVITWDDQERISKYTQTSIYYDYMDDGNIEETKYEYTYSYNYGADSYTITCDEVQRASVDDDYVDAIRRKVSTIPYDVKGDITTVQSYVKLDGATPLYTGWGDKKTVDEVIVSNWWGYVTSHVTNYSDGTSESQGGEGYTFDDEGKITKIVKTRNKNQMGIARPDEEVETIIVTTEFTYDDNGNLTKIRRDEGGEVSSIDFEWTKIPAKLDSQIAMLNGAPHWSVAEYIDNYVDFNWEGRLTVRTYKLSDFLSYVK